MVCCLNDNLPYPPRFEDLDTKHLNGELCRARVLKFTCQENAVQMQHELFMAKCAHPNSIAEAAIFVAVCEGFLGIDPHWDLWTHLFSAELFALTTGEKKVRMAVRPVAALFS